MSMIKHTRYKECHLKPGSIFLIKANVVYGRRVVEIVRPESRKQSQRKVRYETLTSSIILDGNLTTEHTRPVKSFLDLAYKRVTQQEFEMLVHIYHASVIFIII